MSRTVLFLLVLTVLGCSRWSVFNKYLSIENEEWHKDSIVNFTFENTDTVAKKNVFINIRNTPKYPFSTLFLISKITFPNGNKITDTLQYQMANEKGEWLGTGFFSVKENKLFYKENVVFPIKGQYQFSIQQATRSIDDVEATKPLKGILDVGLQIENIE